MHAWFDIGTIPCLYHGASAGMTGNGTNPEKANLKKKRRVLSFLGWALFVWRQPRGGVVIGWLDTRTLPKVFFSPAGRWSSIHGCAVLSIYCVSGQGSGFKAGLYLFFWGKYLVEVRVRMYLPEREKLHDSFREENGPSRTPR